MPKINRPRTLRVAQLGLSVRNSVKLAVKDREKEFGASAALSEPSIIFGPTDGMRPMEPFPSDPFAY
jgi:hypothetical protein